MRLFVGVIPPDEAKSCLEAAVAPVREIEHQMRWIPPRRWHLTLAFLGDVDDTLAASLPSALAVVAEQVEPFDLSLSGAGNFGSGALWAGVAGDIAALRRLAGSVTTAARNCGVRVEDRPFTPHLTLARSRGSADLDRMSARLDGCEGPPWRVASMLLLQSLRTGPEPEYLPVFEAQLGRPLSG